MIKTSSDRTRIMVELAILTALVVVLQLLCSVFTIPVLNITITLSLVPIVIGAALFGPLCGTFLGFALGLTNFATTFANPVLVILFHSSPVLYILTCFGKTMAAGAVAGLLYRGFREKKPFLGVCLASVAAPIVNTGIFFIMMILFFRDAIVEACGSAVGGSVVAFVITGFIGINFLVEFFLNVVLCPAISRIITVVKRPRA